METAISEVKPYGFIANFISNGGIANWHDTDLDAIDGRFEDVEIYFVFSCIGKNVGL